MGKGKKKAEPPSKVRNGGASTSASSSATSSTTTTLTKKEERKMKMMLKKQRHKDRDYSSKEEVEFNETLASLELRVKYVSGDGITLGLPFLVSATKLQSESLTELMIQLSLGCSNLQTIYPSLIRSTRC
jgi:hypothetical protein